jgi:hypothetical protein
MKQSGEYFEIVVFASDGTPYDWPPQNLIMVLDLEHMPAFEHRPMIIDSGYGCVRLPCGDEPFAIGMPLSVTGFGHVHVYADNEGRGYQSREVAKTRLNLSLEFAKSRVAAVRRAQAAWASDLPTPSSSFREAMAGAGGVVESTPEESMEAVAARLRERSSQTVMVVQGGRLVGVIERDDLNRFFSGRRGDRSRARIPPRPDSPS